jgi:probable F420-dependent oxidoreductase
VAEVADGLLVHPFHSEAFLRERTMPSVERGLGLAGRDRSSLSLIIDAIVCCGRDDGELDVATAGTRTLLAFYGSTPAYAPVLEHHGWSDVQPELQALVRGGRWGEMGELITDEMVDTLSIKGSPTEIADQIEHRYGGLADRVAFYLPYAHDDELVTDIIQAIRASSPVQRDR